MNDLLNDVFDKKVEFEGRMHGGQVAADQLLARLRACFNWYGLQDSKFISPIVPGMARTSPRARMRARVLSDEELRALWPLLAKHGRFGVLVKVLLLTAQRRDEVADMARSEINQEGVWTIPASRYKSKRPNIVPLSETAAALINAQDIVDNSDLVFTTNGKTGFSGFSKCKARLDVALLASLKQQAVERGTDPQNVVLPDWRLHDLRRTAKTLMARAGIRPDVSERVLGHVIPGVEGIYDHHDYIVEKRAALEALATMVNRIVSPPANNVVLLREAAE